MRKYPDKIRAHAKLESEDMVSNGPLAELCDELQLELQQKEAAATAAPERRQIEKLLARRGAASASLRTECELELLE